MEAYSVVAMSPRTISSGRREDYVRNIEHIRSQLPRMLYIAGASGAPAKLVVIPEVAIQGFRSPGSRDEDLETTIPGPETQLIGEIAKEFGVHIAGQLFYVMDDRWPGRYFNCAFIVGPTGELVYKRAKIQIEPLEISARKTVVPHDVWDEYPQDMDSLFPVADTELGRIGIMVCMEGGYPEISRGLALNGAEIIIRLTYREPYVSNGFWELQNRAHAHFNNAFVIAPNLGPQLSAPDAPPMDICGGDSMIVDFHGNIVMRRPFAAADTMLSHIIDIDQLRRHRARNGFGNWLKDLRAEQFRLMYDQPIFPANQHLAKAPSESQESDEFTVLQGAINDLRERNVSGSPPTGGKS